MPSGTWGNYSHKGNITKYRGLMELLVKCRPVVKKMEATVPRRGGEATAPRRGGARRRGGGADGPWGQGPLAPSSSLVMEVM